SGAPVSRRTAACAVLAVALLASLPALGAQRPARAPGPAYTNYLPPQDWASDAGEPSVGVDWKTGAGFLQASLHTGKATFAGSTPTWTEVGPIETALLSLDPI